MIKTNQLRLGNFVTEGKVVSIDDKGTIIVEKYDRNGVKNRFILGSNANPIQLTALEFLKLGFTAHHNDYYNKTLALKYYFLKNSGVFKVLVYPAELSSASSIMESILIRYVHEVQNCYFGLTGKELPNGE